jgi:hypothetical protein
MHPKNHVRSTKGFQFDWISDYGPSKGANSARAFLKKNTKKRIRNSVKKEIAESI